MQTVFAVSAAALAVPVAFHLQRSSEASSLDPNAPGMQIHMLNLAGLMSGNFCDVESRYWISAHVTPVSICATSEAIWTPHTPFVALLLSQRVSAVQTGE